MIRYYSRVPAAAVFTHIDGHRYARIPHCTLGTPGTASDKVHEDFKTPRMLRFDSRCFVRNGEAYIWFAERGDKLPVLQNLPFGVTAGRTS